MSGEPPSETIGAGRGRRSVLRLLSGGEGIITGTVVCAAVIAAGAGHTESIAELSVAMVGTITVYWLAHLHAVAIGGAISEGHHPLLALRHSAAETWTIEAASLVPLAILLVAHIAGASLGIVVALLKAALH